NLLVMTDTELIAVRLPATNELWVLERAATAEAPREPLEQSSDSLRARSEGLRDTRSVVVASEPMDDDPAWRLMDSGELIHLGADGTLRSEHPCRRSRHPSRPAPASRTTAWRPCVRSGRAGAGRCWPCWPHSPPTSWWRRRCWSARSSRSPCCPG